ncbi:MAG: VapE family protein [Rubrivivax sp.]
MSTAPRRPSAPDLDALAGMPAAMRDRSQWLCWRFEADPKRPEKPRKVPYYVGGSRRLGTQGDERDRARLVLFDEALQALQAGRYDGIGFAFLPGDGLIGIDIDGAIDADGVVAERCQRIIDACASYTEFSPSGRGVHIIVEGTSETFKDNSIGLEVFCGRQYFTCTGRRWPGAPEEVAPIAADVLRRLKATVAQARKAKGGAAATPGAIAAPAAASPADDLRRKLEGALDRLSPDMGHDDWVVIGMALKHALGEGGFHLWDYWSSRGSKYPGSETLARKWASFSGASSRGTATEATIFKLAVGAGWKPPRAPRVRKGSVPQQEPAARKDAAPGGDPPEGGTPPGDPLAGDAPPGDPPSGDDDDRWRAQLLKTQDGQKKDCRENVYMFLVEHPRLKGLVAYDEFAHRIVKRRKPPWKSPPGEWLTSDDYELGLWLATTKGARLAIKSEATLVAGVSMAANRARFHPVRDYLEALAWDGVPRLRRWLSDCLGAADSKYHAEVGRWFLLGMVNRILAPGCQMDTMLVLEGAQGKQKSTALRVLAGEWFADTPVRVGTADAMLNLAGVWLYEVAELDAFNKAEVTAVKQYITSRVDRVREPYARRPVDRLRSCVLAGSTNQDQYFKDPTGARRFWPVACDGEISLELLRNCRDQLFAEAVHEIRAGERYHPTRQEAAEFIVEQQEAREIVDPWFERLALWLRAEERSHEKSFTVAQLLGDGLRVPTDRIDGARQMATRVGVVMHKLGWTRRRDSTGDRLWRYWRPEGQEARAAEAAQRMGEAMVEQGSDAPPPWSADEWEAHGG